MKIGQKALVANAALLILAGSSVCADDFIFHTKSLVGFEVGYSSAVVQTDDATKPLNSYYKKPSAGFKIGAEGENYRVFIGIRNYFVSGEFDYLTTYGIDGQYMFNFSKYANFFIGANFGMLDAKFQASGERFNREFSDPYYGGDAGFNIHINETFDFELGARYMTTDASNFKNGITYEFDRIATGYASIIIKYEAE